MKAKLQLLVLPALAIISMGVTSAMADTYPILETYKSQAKALMGQAQDAQEADKAALVQSIEAFIQTGSQVMDLYAQKNPNCQAQYTALEQALPQMPTLTVDDVTDRYTHANALPTGPKHCYFGRAEVVYPEKMLIRLGSGTIDSVRDDLQDDLSETLEHVTTLQKNLDNPPN